MWGKFLLRYLSIGCGVFTALLGAAVFCGWIFQLTPMMQIQTSIGLLSLGLSLIFFNLQIRSFSIIMACIPIGLGLLGCAEYIFWLKLTILTTPNAVACFILMGLGLIFANLFRSQLNQLWLAGAVCSVVFSLAAVAIVGNVFGIKTVPVLINLSNMTWLTAVGFISMAMGLFLILIRGVPKNALRISCMFSSLLTVFFCISLLWEPLNAWQPEFSGEVVTNQEIRLTIFFLFIFSILTLGIYLAREVLKHSMMLELARLKAQGVVDAQEILFRHISHEVRNPLNAAMGILTLMKKQNKEEWGESIQRVHSSCHHISRVVENLMCMTNHDRGTLALDLKPFNYDEWGKSVHTICSIVASSHPLEFRFSQEGWLDQSVIGDHTKLSQIVFNLCDNALKYTKKGYVDLLVSFKQEGNQIALSIKIEDSGEGIPEDQKQKIFEFFGRASKEHRFMGAGYGLAICKTYVELMQGTITLISTPGKGTTFIVNIPLRLEEQIKDQAA